MSSIAEPAPIKFSHLQSTHPELHQSLEVIDQAAERSGNLPRTPGVLTGADLDQAERLVPGIAASISGQVANAGAFAMARALDNLSRPVARPARPPAPTMLSDAEVENVIRYAASTNYARTEDDILVSFASRNVNRLTPSQVIRLAGATNYAATEDSILSEFARSQGSRVSAEQMRALANATNYARTEDAMLEGYATSYGHRLSMSEIRMLADATNYSATEDRILRLLAP